MIWWIASQPLSRVNRGANIIMGNAGIRPTPLEARPEIGLLAMEVISSFSTVELFMLKTYMALAGGPKTVAARMYAALETKSAKTQALRAVAEVLPEDSKSTLQALLSWVKSNQSIRDKIAHGIWGYSPQIEDGLLLCNSRSLALNPENIDLEQIFVYKVIDFVNATKSNVDLAATGGMFGRIAEDSLSRISKEMYKIIRADPIIAEKLRRQQEKNS